MTYLSAHQLDECLDANITRRTQNLANRLVNSLVLQFRLLQRRKHLTALGKMSDQHLLDIGLNRGDILEAKKLDRGVDVTRHLAKIAKRRRQEIN